MWIKASDLAPTLTKAFNALKSAGGRDEKHLKALRELADLRVHLSNIEREWIDRKVAPVVQVGDRFVHLVNPDPEAFDIREIAASLAKICRYGGHTVDHYSVAEHSCHIFDHLMRTGHTEKVCRTGLMHDAPEYIIGDMVKPLKMHIGTPFYELENNIWDRMAPRFHCEERIGDAVKRADTAIMMNEKAVVFKTEIPWGWAVDPLPNVKIKFWDWRRAETEFLKRAEIVGML